MTDRDRAYWGTVGALESWARTKNRAARTANGHAASPGSVDYWLARVDPDGEMSAEDREKAARNKQRAYMRRLAKRPRPKNAG